VVEGTGLENRQAGNRLVGSNPTPSASAYLQKSFVKFGDVVDAETILHQRSGSSTSAKLD
jgi:hypothetical protein